ncbi:MAG: ankyrin repeat domain-containing protein [Rhodospirillales bacterium]
MTSRAGRMAPWILAALLLARTAVAADPPSVPDQALLLAAQAGRADLAAYALDRGARVDAADPAGNTALILAAGNPRGGDVVAELLVRGADPKRAAQDGFTALMAAAEKGNGPAVQLLLDAPGDGRALVRAQARDGRTSLHLASVNGWIGIADLLIASGAELEARDAGGGSALYRAAEADVPGLVALLLARGANPDALNPGDGNTAVMMASNRGAIEAVRMLIAAGADVNRRAKDGWTALEAAEMIGDDAIMDLLKQAGAKE